MIDALQVFSSLIIFSSTDDFDEKVRFLFEIFDFNELNSLSLIDLEYMIICVANSTYKTLKMPDKEISEADVSQFLGQDFSEDQRINISALLKWCANKPEVSKFM